MRNSRTKNTQPSESAVDRLALLGRLHETVAQDLGTLGYRLDEIIADSDLDSKYRTQLRDIRLSLMGITQQFRDDIYLTNQRDRQWLRTSLEGALQGLTHSVDLNYPMLIGRYEYLLNEAIYEIARNSLRHASATTFSLSFTMDDKYLKLRIHDDGSGFVEISNSNLGLKFIDQTLKLVAASYMCESSSNGTIYQIDVEKNLLESQSSL